MKRTLFAAIFFMIALCGASGTVGLLSLGYSAVFTAAWQSARIGDGGQKTRFEYHLIDGTFLARNDTYGAHVFVSSGTCISGGKTLPAPCWQQLVTATSMPAGVVNLTTSNSSNLGATEITSCDSATDVMYLLFNNVLYVNTAAKLSASWIATPQTTVQNANSGPKDHGPFLYCDPVNPDIIWVGTNANVRKSVNGRSGASATFSTDTNVGTTGAVPNIFCYDPASSVVGGVTQHFYTFTASDALYETTNGGTSWTRRAGPTTSNHLVCDKFGQVWSVNGSTTVSRLASGSWTSLTVTGNGVASIAPDPNSASVGANKVYAAQVDGTLLVTTNNGTTWTGPNYDETFSAVAPQPVWLATAAQRSAGVPYFNVMDLVSDSSSNLWAAGGIAPWKATAPVPTSLTPWVAYAAGIEQIVVNRIIAPAGLAPLVAGWDRGVFRLSNPDVFPTTQYTNSTSVNQIEGGWGIDYAAGTTTVTASVLSNLSADDVSASSADGGATWTAWPNKPASAGAGGIVAASTATNWLSVPNINAALRYTTNAAASAWLASSVTGCSNDFVTSAFNNRQSIAADRVTTGTFYAIDGSFNVCKSTDSGANFAKVSSNVFTGGFAYRDSIVSVPGNAGHLFWYSGPQSLNQIVDCYKSTNAGTTWATCGLKEVIAMGFGAALPGGSGYPMIYALGWKSGVLGYYASSDAGATWALISVPASQQTWAFNSIDLVQSITGDMNVYGRVYSCFLGSGCSYIDTADACPWVNFSNVNPNAALTGTVTLTAVHSGLVPVTGVTFKVDSTTIATFTGNGPYSTSWNANGGTSGAHTLTVEATGNCSTKGSFSIPITTVANDLLLTNGLNYLLLADGASKLCLSSGC